MLDPQAHKTPFFRSENIQLHSRSQKNLTFYCLLVGCLLFILAGCANSSTPVQVKVSSPTATLAPTPTIQAVPSGTVLYKTDWSQGLSGWNAPTGKGLTAQGSKGQLHLTCTNFVGLTIPYQPTVANYSIETSIQIVSTHENGGTFTMNTQPGGGKDGYTLGTAALETKFPFHGEVEGYINPTTHTGSRYAADFSPGSQWVTYRFDIQDNTATLYINGARHGQTLSTQAESLSNGPLVFNCGAIEINMGPLTITAL